MQTLLLKADERIIERIKQFLSLIPKENLEIIDPFEIGFVSAEEEWEIKAILEQNKLEERAEGSKRVYDL